MVTLLHKALHQCHQHLSLACNFAGWWALVPTMQGPGDPCGSWMQHHIYGTGAAHSCAASDMKLIYQLWPLADSERFYPVQNIICLAAAELSKFSVIFFPPHWQKVNSCSSLILSKLRSNQNVIIRFIDHSAMQNLMDKKRLWQSLPYFSLTTSGWTNFNDLFKSNQCFIPLVSHCGTIDPNDCSKNFWYFSI